MPTHQNKRINSLSTRYLGFYKNSVLVLLIGFVGFLVVAGFKSFLERGDYFNSIFTTGYISFFIYGWLRINRNVHRVEFDDEFLFVLQPGQDILIPLENIKEVEIKSLGGVYEVELFNPEQLGRSSISNLHYCIHLILKGKMRLWIFFEATSIGLYVRNNIFRRMRCIVSQSIRRLKL
jgi:hypothetical protein